MLKQEHKALLPYEVYVQIEEICKSVHEIQSQAVGILQNSKVPDSAAQLQDVLQTTESATMTIIDTVTAIQSAVDEAKNAALSEQVGTMVTKVYEACSFQDISGQMIKKVLDNLTLLEGKLGKLSETAKAYGVLPPEQSAAVPAGDSALMNGPQLSGQAPSQADIDKLFGSN